MVVVVVVVWFEGYDWSEMVYKNPETVPMRMVKQHRVYVFICHKKQVVYVRPESQHRTSNSIHIRGGD